MYENGAARYGALKAASDQVLARHTQASSRPKSIDFEAYKKALPGQAAWVADLEKQFKAATIPKPKDSYSASIAEAAQEAKGELAVLQALPPVEQMTMADIYKFLP